MLPPGLRLSDGGDLTGTPSAVGTSNFTAQVVDSSTPQQTATQPLSITIAGQGGAQGNAQLNGNYAFSFTGITGNSSASSTFATVGRFTADVAGIIAYGEMDTNGVRDGAASHLLHGNT